MAQLNFEEKVIVPENEEKDLEQEIVPILTEPTYVMTGGTTQSRFLYYQLKMSIKKAIKIDIIVSFLMESGVRMILKDLKEALGRGTRIRILTGNYLGITQPSALYLLKKELGNCVDLRFFNDKSRSFHPKSYMFHYGNISEIYIGSSNISKSALTQALSGITVLTVRQTRKISVCFSIRLRIYFSIILL